MAEVLASLSLIITAIGGIVLGVTQHRQNIQAVELSYLKKELKKCEAERRKMERRLDEYDRWRARNEGYLAP